jgi:hypothetical protein
MQGQNGPAHPSDVAIECGHHGKHVRRTEEDQGFGRSWERSQVVSQWMEGG